MSARSFVAAALTALAACSIPDKELVSADAPVTDAPVTDAAATDAPVIDAPVIDAPSIDAAVDAPADAPTDAPAPPVLEFGQATYGFINPVAVDGGSAMVMMTLTNTGAGPARNIASSVVPSGAGLTVSNNCPATLNPNASCVVTATFDPTIVGMSSYTVTATSLEGPSDSAQVTGTGSAILSVTLSLVANGGLPASGTVTSNPAGISCSSGTCMGTFTQTPVTLTATEPGEATLSDWGIVSCPVIAPCNVTLAADRAVTVTFKAPMTYTDSTTSIDQAEGVAYSNDGTIVIGGFRSNVALIQRIDGTTGAFGSQMTFGGGTVRTFRDVSVAPNQDIGTSGEVTGNVYDARKSEITPDFAMERSTFYTNADAGQDYGLGVCHDSSNNLYMVGQQTGLMFFGRWPANTYNPTWLRTGVSGVANDVTFDAGTLWVAGTQGGNGWLGKLNASDGVQVTFINPTMTTALYGVAAYGAAEIVVVGVRSGNLIQVDRYTQALGLVWSRTFAGPATMSGGAIGIDPVSSAIYVAATDGSTCQLLKLNPNGNQIWSRAIWNGYCDDLAVNADGVVVAGWNIVVGNRNVIAKKYFH